MADEAKKPVVNFTNHPKASAAVVAAAAGTLVIATLQHYGIDPSQAVQSAIQTLLVAAAAYLAPNPQ